MANLKEVFSAAAGEDVTYLRYDLKGRELTITYAIDGLKKQEFFITARLMNCSDREWADKAKVAGTLAGQRAFRETGKYDQQLKQLSEGKLAK